MKETSENKTVIEVLKNSNIQKLWLAQIISSLGDAATQLALVLQINEISGGSPSAIAGLLVAFTLPVATIGVFGGALADRYSRKWLMFLSDILRTIIVFCFVLMTIFGVTSIWVFYMLAFIHGVFGSVFDPARMALIPNLAEEDELYATNTLSQLTSTFTRIIGTAIAGIVVGSYGSYVLIYGVDGITFFLSAYFILTINYTKPVTNAQENFGLGSTLTQLKEGFQAVIQERILIAIMIGFGGSVLGLGAVTALMPSYLINDLQVHESWFGIIETIASIAMLLGGILLSIFIKRIKPQYLMSSFLFVMGLLFIPFYVAESIWHILILQFGVSLVIIPIQASGGTLIQTVTPNHVLGRVAAILNAIIQTSTLGGMAVSGIIASRTSERLVFLWGGMVVCCFALIMWLIIPSGQFIHDNVET